MAKQKTSCSSPMTKSLCHMAHFKRLSPKTRSRPNRHSGYKKPCAASSKCDNIHYRGLSMSIFEYKCKKCSHLFEEFIRGTADDKNICCPKCGSNSVIKQFSAFGMFSKGNISGASASTGSSCGSCSATTCSTCRT